MNFFVIDSPFMRFMGKVGDILILNMLFVITSLPIVTIGTALSALYTVTLKIARGDDPSVIKDYFKAYRGNFKTATICWLIMAISGILLIMDFYLIGLLEKGSTYTIFRLLLAVILGVWALLFLYLFPYIARFENSCFNSFKNALFLSVAHIPVTLFMLIMSIGVFVLTLFSARSFTISLIIWVFFGCAFLAYVYSLFLSRVFAKYETKQ